MMWVDLRLCWVDVIFVLGKPQVNLFYPFLASVFTPFPESRSPSRSLCDNISKQERHALYRNRIFSAELQADLRQYAVLIAVVKRMS
jgi:hypothetical protein